VGCECHVGDIGSPECGKKAICQIVGVFVCGECKIAVLTRYPSLKVVEETASDWEDRIRTKLKILAILVRYP
jgi:hypothetical protein